MSNAVANRVVMPRVSVRHERERPRGRGLAVSSPSSDNPARAGVSLSYDVGENAHPKTHPDMDADRRRPGVANPEPLAPEATIELLALVRNGDRAALDRLLERCIPALRRWAHGRLPQWTRGVIETSDLVQECRDRGDGPPRCVRGALPAARPPDAQRISRDKVFSWGIYIDLQPFHDRFNK